MSLPAIAVEDENYFIQSPFGALTYIRKFGEALHPERDSVETYQKIRETVGEYDFQSQYQQDPVPREGGAIKRLWLCYYDPETLPSCFTMILQSWDTASKSGELNDYSVCTTWGFNDGKFYLLNVFRERLTYPELKRAFHSQWARFQPDKVLIEDKSSGTQLIQDLQAEGICGIEAVKPPPGSDKIMRLHAQSVKFEAGKVLLPQQASWLDQYIHEIAGFPGTKYDDQVDSTSQALEYLGSAAQAGAVWEKMADI